jgi:hypothetical protein
MKKVIASLLTAMMLTISLASPFVGGTQGVYAYSDGALAQRFAATGNYGIAAAGVGLNGGAPGDISLDVPGSVFKAYLYWAGYAVSTNPDDFDSVSFSVDGDPSTTVDADWVSGPEPWPESPDCYHYVFGADVTSLVESGDRDYTISGEGLAFTEPYGAGLMVVYGDGSLPVSYVSIKDGLDSFHCAYAAPQGPDSEVTCFDFASDTEEHSADVTMFVGGVMPPDPEVRPNAIWYQTGDSAQPDNLIDAGGTELDGGPPAPYPLGSSDGQQWDTYGNSVDVPAGDSWLGLQIESVSDGEGTCCHGLFVAAGMVIPSDSGCCTTTGSYTVCTDKADYTSGETVHITGSGFAAGAELTIKVIRPNGSVVTFGLDVPLFLNYDPALLDPGALSVVLAYYDVETGLWVISPPVPGVVAAVGQIGGMMSHFSSIAVMAELPPEPEPPAPVLTPVTLPPQPPPAHFVTSDLSVVPSRKVVGLGRLFTLMVRTGDSVTITANVGNDGGRIGNHVAGLKINGDTLSTRDLTLLPGQSKDIAFTLDVNELGYYTVQVDNLSGEFQTAVWVNWWLFGGLIAVLALLIWLGWYYGYRRRRRFKG